MKIPKAKAAVDAEWDKLGNKKAWLLDTVRERRDVENEAKKKGKKVHFGSLMDLCSEKNAELAVEKTTIQRASSVQRRPGQR